MKTLGEYSYNLGKAIRGCAEPEGIVRHPFVFLFLFLVGFAVLGAIVSPTNTRTTHEAAIFAGTTIVPVEDGARIDEVKSGDGVVLVNGLVPMVWAAGYRCDSVSALTPLNWSESRSARGLGFNLFCNKSRYHYSVADVGGNKVVSVK